MAGKFLNLTTVWILVIVFTFVFLGYKSVNETTVAKENLVEDVKESNSNSELLNIKEKIVDSIKIGGNVVYKNPFLGKWERKMFGKIVVVVIIESDKIYFDAPIDTGLTVYSYKLIEKNKLELVNVESNQTEIVPVEFLSEGNMLIFDNILLSRSKE